MLLVCKGLAFFVKRILTIAGALPDLHYRGMTRFLILAVFCTMSPAVAEGVDMVSQVDELTITALNHVGSNPNGPVSKDCVYVVANTVTPEGQGIARLGWAVTAEIERNGLIFVSFAGRAEAGTSGSCLLSDGNIGIFRAGRMEGLIYAAPGAKRGIGIVAPIKDGLRVWDGDFLQRPLADLQLHGDDLVVVSAVAGRDMFCDGMVSVPNIYGIPIHLARRLLLAEGWVPQPPDVVPSLMMTDLPELLDCAGTGFAACTYLYRSAEAPELMVTTAGEAEPPSSPAVVRYDVSCMQPASGN